MGKRPFADERRRKQNRFYQTRATPFSVRDAKSRTWNLVPFGLVNGLPLPRLFHLTSSEQTEKLVTFSVLRLSLSVSGIDICTISTSFDSRHQPHIYNSIRTGTTMFISSLARNTHNTTLQRRKPPSSNRFQLWSTSRDFDRSLTPAFLTTFTNIRLLSFSRSSHLPKWTRTLPGEEVLVLEVLTSRLLSRVTLSLPLLPART